LFNYHSAARIGALGDATRSRRHIASTLGLILCAQDVLPIRHSVEPAVCVSRLLEQLPVSRRTEQSKLHDERLINVFALSQVNIVAELADDEAHIRAHLPCTLFAADDWRRNRSLVVGLAGVGGFCAGTNGHPKATSRECVGGRLATWTGQSQQALGQGDASA